MNALIHIATGFGISLIVAETNTDKLKIREKLGTSFLGLTLSFVSHALLDYTPHCYPINSKIDFIAAALLLLSLTLLAAKNYRLVVVSCLVGSVLPDIIDLLPKILNKQLGFNFPEYNNLFPWHWKSYSGSI